MFDAAVIGGGPAGLTAALYLARFRLSVFLADAGNSGRRSSPELTINPFGQKVSADRPAGTNATSSAKHPVQFVRAEVDNIRQLQGGFELRMGGAGVHAKAIIVATGVVNRRPRMSDLDHDEALRQGLFRYCPICDGYEITDRTIAVVGEGEGLYRERSSFAAIPLLSQYFPKPAHLVYPIGWHCTPQHLWSHRCPMQRTIKATSAPLTRPAKPSSASRRKARPK